MKFGHSLDVLRKTVNKHLVSTVQGRGKTGAIKRDVVANAEADLAALGDEFDPWDGPIPYALSKAYDERASRVAKSTRGVDVAVRWLEVAHNAQGDRVDRAAAQLLLVEAHEALDRREASVAADLVMVNRWRRVLAAADREAEKTGADPRKATLGKLIGEATLVEWLAGVDEDVA